MCKLSDMCCIRDVCVSYRIYNASADVCCIHDVCVSYQI